MCFSKLKKKILCFRSRRPPIHVFIQLTFTEYILWNGDFPRKWLYENERDPLCPLESCGLLGEICIKGNTWPQTFPVPGGSLDDVHEKTHKAAVNSAPLGSAKASPKKWQQGWGLKTKFEFSLMEGRTMCIPGRITDVRNTASSWVVLTVIPQPASISSGNLLDMQILGNHPWNSGLGSAICVLTSPPADSLHTQLWEALLQSVDGIKGRKKYISQVFVFYIIQRYLAIDFPSPQKIEAGYMITYIIIKRDKVHSQRKQWK